MRMRNVQQGFSGKYCKGKFPVISGESEQAGEFQKARTLTKATS